MSQHIVSAVRFPKTQARWHRTYRHVERRWMHKLKERDEIKQQWWLVSKKTKLWAFPFLRDQDLLKQRDGAASLLTVGSRLFKNQTSNITLKQDSNFRPLGTAIRDSNFILLRDAENDGGISVSFWDLIGPFFIKLVLTYVSGSTNIRWHQPFSCHSLSLVISIFGLSIYDSFWITLKRDQPIVSRTLFFSNKASEHSSPVPTQ